MDIQTESMNFLVLIGSRARGDASERSDTDVLAVGSPFPGGIEDLSRFAGHLNVVSYDVDTFSYLQECGSLFLQHCFLEGILLAGAERLWGQLKSRFVVQRDFSREVQKCAAACRLFLRPAVFGGHYLAPCINAYTQVKNASIFFLAHHGRYTFNKSQAIWEAAEYVRFSHVKTLISLIDVYDYSVRWVDIPLPFPLDDKEAGSQVLGLVTDFMRSLYDACS